MKKKTFYELFDLPNCSDFSAVVEAHSKIMDALNEETATYYLFDQEDMNFISDLFKTAMEILRDPVSKKLYDEYLYKTKKAYIPIQSEEKAEEIKVHFSSTPGQRIKSLRIKKQISIEDAFRNTKISVDLINAIENENFEKLPYEVYLKGLLKQYLKFLGEEDSGLINEYLKNFRKRIGEKK